jgi:hypothetical protein
MQKLVLLSLGVMLKTSKIYGNRNLLRWLWRVESVADVYRALQYPCYFSALLSVTKINIMPCHTKTLAYSSAAVSQQLFRRCECAV